MRIEIKDNSVCLGDGHVIKMEEFPNGYCKYLACETEKTVMSTADAEKAGADILKGDLGDANKINDFVSVVIRWGEGNRGIVHGMVFPLDTKIVAESAIFLQSGNLKSAIDRIKDVHGFCISYGSKVLRMLSPEKAGAYDKILRRKLPAYRGIEGYVEFCDACQKVVGELKKSDIKSPHRKNGEWYVADVEAVIYYYFRYEAN